MNRRFRWLRCLAVWLAASAGLGAVATLAAPTAGVSVAGPFDVALVRLASVALLACAGWGWVVATLVVASAVRGSVSRVPAPAVVRRLLLAACGTALSTGMAAGLATPALAAGGGSSLAGLPFPDRAVAAQPRHRPVETVTVGPVDTLWSLAASRLPADASEATIATACRRLYQLNRAVIGDDPDLIQPGQRLALPPGERHA